MSSNKLLISSAILGSGAIAIPIATSMTSLKTNRLITVHFYDSSSQEKKIRFPFESLSLSSIEIDNNGTWTSNINTSDQAMYEKLFNIGHKFVKTQKNLNYITFKSISEEKDKKFLDINKNCKCKDKKCEKCLCCCQTDKECKLEDFAKVQKTFAYLLSETDSGKHDIYLNPIEANIKLTDLTFEQLKTESAEKSFIASLTYSFVDYWHKQIQYKNIISSDQKSNLDNLEDNKNYYFSNIPQMFWFNGSSDKENNIDKALSETNKTNELLKKISESKEGQEDNDLCCCCSDSNKISCLIKRNFVLKSETKNNINEIIKNLPCKKS